MFIHTPLEVKYNISPNTVCAKIWESCSTYILQIKHSNDGLYSAFPRLLLWHHLLQFKWWYTVILIRPVDRSTFFFSSWVIIHSFRIKQPFKICGLWSPPVTFSIHSAHQRIANPQERMQEDMSLHISTERKLQQAQRANSRRRTQEERGRRGKKRREGGGMERIMMKTMRGADADERRDDDGWRWWD